MVLALKSSLKAAWATQNSAAYQKVKKMLDYDDKMSRRHTLLVRKMSSKIKFYGLDDEFGSQKDAESNM